MSIDTTVRSYYSERESGLALIIALIALFFLSLLGFYIAVNAGTEILISDNHEAAVHARCAARAGINHAREALRGIDFNDVLVGPTGKYPTTGVFLAEARGIPFRNPLDWAAAVSIDIDNPGAWEGGFLEYGLINTGLAGGTPGAVIIPRAGIAFDCPNPNGEGILTTARYFVRAADNNGEATELSRDPADNPFVDGDGIILLRSVGVARTVGQQTDSTVRRNSVSVFEARFRRNALFDLGSPLAIEGDQIEVLLDAAGTQISGGPGGAGIGIIDTDPSNEVDALKIVSRATQGVTGTTGGGFPSPSVKAISLSMLQTRLLDPAFMGRFTRDHVANWADGPLYAGPVVWEAGSAPNLGSYDPGRPINDPRQQFKLTCVQGDLTVGGGISGAGLLVVTGELIISGPFEWRGLLLLIGRGSVKASDLDPGITGGLFIASVETSGAGFSFGVPVFHMRGTGKILYDEGAIRKALSLLPVSQVGFREITRSMDP